MIIWKVRILHYTVLLQFWNKRPVSSPLEMYVFLALLGGFEICYLRPSVTIQGMPEKGAGPCPLFIP